MAVCQQTEQGQQVMEQLYPEFNRGETEIVTGLSKAQLDEFAHLLRHVVRNMKEYDVNE